MNDIIITYGINNYVLNKRLSDGMYDATLLLEQHNARFKPVKRLDIFIRNESTGAFIRELKQTPSVTPIAVVRGKRDDGVRKKTVWLCPQLFTQFAFWLNPECGASVGKCVFDGICDPTDTEDGYNVLIGLLGVTDTERFKTSFERIAGVMPKTKPDDAQNAEIKALQNHILNLVKNKSYGYDDVIKEFSVLYNTKFNI